MTIGIIFHHMTPVGSKFFVDYTFWDDFLAVWNFDFLIMVTDHEAYDKRENTFTTLQEAIDAFPTHDFVALDPSGITKLQDYTHPADNIIYIMGDDNWKVSGMPEEITKIKIDTPIDSNARPLRAFAVANAVAFHRNSQV